MGTTMHSGMSFGPLGSLAGEVRRKWGLTLKSARAATG